VTDDQTQPETETSEDQSETPIDEIITALLSGATAPDAPREAVDRPSTGAGALFDPASLGDDAEAQLMIQLVQMVKQAFDWPMPMLIMALQTAATLVDSGALPSDVAQGARNGWLVLSAVHSLRQRAGE
jgi:hypothetical protein